MSYVNLSRLSDEALENISLVDENCQTLQQSIRHIDLLLVGKTGHGKSATGNSILRNKGFNSQPSTSSVTDNVQYAVTRHNNFVIKVTDTPGLADTAEIYDPVLASKKIMKQMQNAVILNPDGYHAFLLVFRYNIRFTKEENEVVKRLKHIFGENFIKTYCIIVITHGDHFGNYDGREVHFRQWLNEQKEHFHDLIKECQGRAVLFDNYTVDNIMKESQLNELINCVERLDTGGKRYRDTHFEQAEKSRNQLLDRTLFGLVSEELIKIGLILERIANLFKPELKKECIINLENLFAETDNLNEKLKKNHHNHELHRAFIQLVSKIKKSIRTYSKGLKEAHRHAKILDKNMKDESKRLADILYRYVTDDSVDDMATISTVETSIHSWEMIFSEREAKIKVINELKGEIPLKTIIAKHDWLKTHLEKIENDFKTETDANEIMYINLKVKCNDLLTEKSACTIF